MTVFNSKEGNLIEQPEDKLITIKVVMDRSGLKETSIYKKMKTGEFPKSVKIGPKAIRWSNNAISEWVNRQLNQTSESM